MKIASRIACVLAIALAVSVPAHASPPTTTTTHSQVVPSQPAAATVMAVPAFAAESTDFTTPASRGTNASFVVLLVGLGLMGSIRSVTTDKDTAFASDTVRQQLNRVIEWLYYASRNKVLSSITTATPQVAIATTTTKVKTAQATVLLNAGVMNALAASDNAWTLTGANLADGQSRKYLLLASGADAFTVQQSSDAAVAADCAYPSLPADGLAVVGSMRIDNASGAAFVPGTTALTGVTGLTVTYFDAFADDAVFPFAKAIP